MTAFDEIDLESDEAELELVFCNDILQETAADSFALDDGLDEVAGVDININDDDDDGGGVDDDDDDDDDDEEEEEEEEEEHEEAEDDVDIVVDVVEHVKVEVVNDVESD